MPPRSIPQSLLDDDALGRTFKVRLAEALALKLDESDWKKLATLHGLEGQITSHRRFLQSKRFDDPDFEGHVLDLVKHLFDYRPEIIVELFERREIARWFEAKAPELIAAWQEQADPLIEAIGHALDEVEGVAGVIDLSVYTGRVQAALPGDPHLAIGATKDMLEATMRTILHRRNVGEVDKFDFPGLVARCFTELGLSPTGPPASAGERHLRKIASSARTMIETANALRNLAGTGHGRVVGEEEDITPADASLVASSGLVLVAWLLNRHKDTP